MVARRDIQDKIARASAAYTGWLSDTRHRAVASIALSACVCFFLVLCVAPLSSDDDWTISYYLSTRLDGTGLSLYINALLSQLIHAMNVAWPGVNWFFVVEYAWTFAVLAGLTYAALTYIRPGAALVLLGYALVFVVPHCIRASNYTYLAALSTAAGGFMLVAQVRAAGTSRWERVLAVALVVGGVAWRVQMAAAGVPFVLLGFAWQLLGLHKEGASLRVPLLWLGVTVACCMLLLGYDRIVWQADGWRQWNEYDEIRRITSDYPMPSYDGVAEELAAFNVSENDYRMICGWASGDVDVLNADVLSQVASLRIPLPHDMGSLLAAARFYFGISMGQWMRFMVIALALVLVGYRRRLSYGVALLELAGGFVACTYFVLIQRLIDRSEAPTWMLAVALALALAEPEMGIRARGMDGKLESNHGLWQLAGTCVGGAFLAVAMAVMVRGGLPKLSWSGFTASLHLNDYQSGGVLTAYMEEHPDDTFVMDSGLYASFELEFRLRYLPPSELAERVMPMGGWGSGSPFRLEQARRVGATNPFQALLTGERTYLITREEIADHVRIFLEEHYADAVTCTRVSEEPVDGAASYVWKFSAN